MKKRAVLAAAALAAFMVPNIAGAEGFGIVEWSTEGVAMGGARMFAEDDPAMIAHNPASITKVNDKALSINATYISPHGQYETKNNAMAQFLGAGATQHGENRIHPGIVPGTFYVQKMTDKDWWGIGAFTRYGMISGFQPGSVPSSNNLFAKLNGLSVTPVYAHKFDKKWSAAVGAELNYVGLEMNQEINLGMMKTHLKGESVALGWNVAGNYRFDDKNEMGVVYRSKIKHSLEADFDVYGMMRAKGDAYGEVMLPDQWSIGYGHKFDAKNRVELNATRTKWHTYDALNIMISNVNPAFDGMHNNNKGYKDTWRYAIGYEHKFSDKYSGMLGFAFDDHAIPYNGGDFIVPTGIRRTYSCGVQYHDKKHTVAVALAWQDIGNHTFGSTGGTDMYTEAHTHDNFAKIFSVGYGYRF